MSAEKNLSQMIVDVAGRFIELETSEQGRQANLLIACKAWNLAVLPKSERNKAYHQYLDEMRSVIKDKETMKWFKKDLNGLMKAKRDLYPAEKALIADARLEHVDANNYRVIVSYGKISDMVA